MKRSSTNSKISPLHSMNSNSDSHWVCERVVEGEIITFLSKLLGESHLMLIKNAKMCDFSVNSLKCEQTAM